MAILDREDPYGLKGWLTWTIELMRRGLKPHCEITVHGPHAPDPGFMWGEAECSYLGEGTIDVGFRSARTSTIWDVRGVRVRSKDDREYFPILKAKDLPEWWRKEIQSLKAKLTNMESKELPLESE